MSEFLQSKLEHCWLPASNLLTVLSMALPVKEMEWQDARVHITSYSPSSALPLLIFEATFTHPFPVSPVISWKILDAFSPLKSTSVGLENCLWFALKKYLDWNEICLWKGVSGSWLYCPSSFRCRSPTKKCSYGGGGGKSLAAAMVGSFWDLCGLFVEPGKYPQTLATHTVQQNKQDRTWITQLLLWITCLSLES